MDIKKNIRIILIILIACFNSILLLLLFDFTLPLTLQIGWLGTVLTFFISCLILWILNKSKSHIKTIYKSITEGDKRINAIPSYIYALAGIYALYNAYNVCACFEIDIFIIITGVINCAVIVSVFDSLTP